MNRKYFRHPTSVPIEYTFEDITLNDKDYLKNISIGGIAFYSRKAIPLDTIIEIKIPILKPIFRIKSKVMWCRKINPESYEVGAEFLDNRDIFRTRMVEQICYIESYKKAIRENEGRTLTSEEAALEWIEKNADSFPVV